MYKNAKMIYFKDLTNKSKNCWKERYLDISGDVYLHCSSRGQWIEFIPYSPCPLKGIGEWFHTSVGYFKTNEKNKEIELITSHSIYRFVYEKEEIDI